MSTRIDPTPFEGDDGTPCSTEIGHLSLLGVMVTVSPDEADSLGAFQEDALSPGDAWDSRFDDAAPVPEPHHG
ncbi:MAG: hypothetical protein M0006_15780 [Magnetospirillum sp.]|nr:hypothetical protein [Magnetospirillum sp.]